jgi:serine/threonine protein kinase
MADPHETVKTVDLRGARTRSARLAEGSQPPSSWCRTCRTIMFERACFCGNCGQRLRVRRDVPAGTILDGAYEVGNKLAEGGFAAVYHGRCITSGRPLALKILHADLAADPRLVTRFRREGKNLVRLRDPHTIAAHGYGEFEGTHYLVLELLVGETLQRRLDTVGPLPWRDVLGVMRAVASSLAEAHAHGIVHRDLKPSNIHLADAGGVKLIDFGLARVYGDEEQLTRSGQTVGTRQYMAPEQLTGLPCDGRSDLYALGVVAYQMLAGVRPFTESSAEAQLDAMLSRWPAMPSKHRSRREVPEEVDRLVLRCLAANPDGRFADAAELIAAIDEALAARVAPTPRAHMWMSLSMFVASGIGAGLALAQLV